MNPNDMTGTEFLQQCVKAMKEKDSTVLRLNVTINDNVSGFLYLSTFDPTDGSEWDE